MPKHSIVQTNLRDVTWALDVRSVRVEFDLWSIMIVSHNGISQLTVQPEELNWVRYDEPALR